MPRRAPPALLALALAARAACGADAPRERGDYEIILERSPFGPPPPTAGVDADPGGPDGAGGAGAKTDGPAAPPPPAPVRLSSSARYDGVPSAGLVELSSGRTFVLRPGEGWGPYRLVDALPEAGAVVVAKGTNEWFVSLSWAKGQATNLVPSAREPYLTTFRPNAPKTEVSLAANAESAEEGPGAESEENSPPASGNMVLTGRRSSARAASELTDEEEADLLRRATVTDADGTTHVSFRELNRLRVEARRRKAEAARAEALAAAEALRAERAREAAERKAAEEEAAAEKAEAEKAHRAAVVAALAQGYDVDVDFELTEEEAAQLKEAGFDVPEEDAE